MRRLALVVLTLFLPAVVFGLAASGLEPSGLPAGVQQAIDEYTAFRRAVLPPAARVEAAVHASVPANFSREMSHLSFGNGQYFQTAFSYWQAATVPFALPTAIRTTGAGLSPLPIGGPGATASQRPLPYPPDNLWCLRVAEPDGSRHVTFVALHGDLHIATWVVHELAWEMDWPSTREVLVWVGCELEE